MTSISQAARRPWRVICAAVLLLGGCQEPDYAYYTTPTAQGGVELRRVPKPPAPTARTENPAAPAVRDIVATTPPDVRQRLGALEAEVHQLKTENERLRSATAPAAR